MKKLICVLLALAFVFSLSAGVALAGGDQNHGSVGEGSVIQDWKCVMLDGVCPLSDE